MRNLPAQDLFALHELGVELVSLQRDDADKVEIPDYVIKPNLNTWEDSVAVMSRCDLVITSCTSIAHFAAAMGKPTWIPITVMPWTAWATPGPTTPWYDSVRLFRQEARDDWTKPMADLRRAVAGVVAGAELYSPKPHIKLRLSA